MEIFHAMLCDKVVHGLWARGGPLHPGALSVCIYELPSQQTLHLPKAPSQEEKEVVSGIVN